MTRQLTAAIRRAVESGRKVAGPAGVSVRVLDDDDEAELEEFADETPQERPERAEDDDTDDSEPEVEAAAAPTPEQRPTPPIGR